MDDGNAGVIHVVGSVVGTDRGITHMSPGEIIGYTNSIKSIMIFWPTIC